MNERTEERLFELLADRAMFGLNAEEQAELQKLENEFPELAGDISFDRAAASLQIAALGEVEPVPASLRSRLESDAAKYFSSRTEEREFSDNIVEVKYESPKPTFMQWLGWALAGAACLALVANIWMSGFGPTREVVKENAPPPPTIEQKREALLASAGPGIVRTEWTSPQEEADLKGEVVWSDSKQEGYMTFRNLPVNDSSKETYQLWIFDENQDEATPVDGGVFDVSKEGEAIIPIDAKIKVKNPKAFAVTVEKPGGVVVSKREKIVALAKVSA